MDFADFFLNYVTITDIFLVLDLFKYKNIRSGVSFQCGNDLSNFKTFLDNNIKISTRNLISSNFDYSHIPRNYERVGIILDTSCEVWERVLEQNKADLKSPFVWIIITSNVSETFEIMSKYPIEVDSDVNIAHKINNTFDLYEIYHTGFSKNGVFITRKTGCWNKTLVMNKLNRYDLKGLTLRSVVVINQNQKVVNTTFLHYLETERPSLRTVDPMHKFKYFEVMKYYKEMFNLSIKFQRSNSWGYPTNGTFDGMVGALQRNEADIGGSPIFIRTDRAKAIVYAAETWETRPCFIFRHPKHHGGFFGIYTRPLTAQVWYCIIALVVSATTILAAMLRLRIIKLDGDEADDSTSLAFLCIWSAICQQGMSITRNSTSIKIVIFVTFASTVTLYQYYNATVVSTLLREPPKYIKTMEDLIKSNLKVGIEDVLYTKDFFKRTTDPLAIEMYKKKVATGSHKNYYPSEVGVSMVKRGGFAFHVDSAVAYRIMRWSYAERELCDAQEISMFVGQFVGATVTKGSPYKEHIAYAIRKLKESGIMHRLRNLWDESRPTCVRTPDASVFSVSIREFSTALIVLSVGLIAAVVVLCGELLVYKFESSRVVEFRH